jgi:hypothetical protein
MDAGLRELRRKHLQLWIRFAWHIPTVSFEDWMSMPRWERIEMLRALDGVIQEYNASGADPDATPRRRKRT